MMLVSIIVLLCALLGPRKLLATTSPLSTEEHGTVSESYIRCCVAYDPEGKIWGDYSESSIRSARKYYTGREPIRQCALANNQGTKPKAFIHIGPHKTASTHIQTFLSDNLNIIRNHGLHPLFNESHGAKYYAPFAADLLNQVTDSDIIALGRSHISEHLIAGRSIVFSSETLCALGHNAIALMLELFAGFEVHIVFVFRDILTRTASKFVHEASNPGQHGHSGQLFADFFVDSSQQQLYARMIGKYITAVGKNRVYGIDYQGCAAAGVSLEYVFLNDIAGLKHLFKDSKLDKTPHVENPMSAHTSLVLSEFIHKVLYVELLNCTKSIASRITFSELESFMKELEIIATDHPGHPIPTKETLLTKFSGVTEVWDYLFIEEFGSIIYYKNRTANILAVQNSKPLRELDTEAVRKDEFWVDWVHLKGQIYCSGKDTNVLGRN